MADQGSATPDNHNIVKVGLFVAVYIFSFLMFSCCNYIVFDEITFDTIFADNVFATSFTEEGTFVKI